MKRKCTIYIVLCLLIGVLPIQNLFAEQAIQNVYSKADILFSQKKYREALHEYTLLKDSAIIHENLYYNMAVCEAALRNPGNALYYLELSDLCTANHDANLDLRNLLIESNQLDYEYANKNLIVYIINSKIILPIMWVLAIFSIALLIFMLYYRLIKKQTLTNKWSIMSWTLFIVGIIISMITYANNIDTSPKRAIIKYNKTEIKSTPDDNSGNNYVLDAGNCFRITDKIGQWYKLENANNKNGWVAENKLWLLSQ